MLTVARELLAGAAWRSGHLPRPFWTVRVLGTIRTCEEPKGCGRSARNAAITVAPICEDGALNPMNMRVTCYYHDSYNLRLQPFGKVQEVWKGREHEVG